MDDFDSSAFFGGQYVPPEHIRIFKPTHHPFKAHVWPAPAIGCQVPITKPSLRGLLFRPTCLHRHPTGVKMDPLKRLEWIKHRKILRDIEVFETYFGLPRNFLEKYARKLSSVATKKLAYAHFG